MLHFHSHSPEETLRFGQTLARCLQKGDILALYGELGSGKTTLVKGMAKGLKVPQDQVHSPTFVLMNSYEGRLPVYHFDFYRLENPEEIQEIGYEEFLYGHGVSVIEWAERFGSLLPEEYLECRLTMASAHARRFKLQPHGPRYEWLLSRLKDKIVP